MIVIDNGSNFRQEENESGRYWACEIVKILEPQTSIFWRVMSSVNTGSASVFWRRDEMHRDEMS